MRGEPSYPFSYQPRTGRSPERSFTPIYQELRRFKGNSADNPAIPRRAEADGAAIPALAPAAAPARQTAPPPRAPSARDPAPAERFPPSRPRTFGTILGPDPG